MIVPNLSRQKKYKKENHKLFFLKLGIKVVKIYYLINSEQRKKWYLIHNLITCKATRKVLQNIWGHKYFYLYKEISQSDTF